VISHLSPDAALAAAVAVERVARTTPFYAAHLKGHPEPHDAASWRALPPLTRQDLFDNTYPRSTAMLSRPVEGMIVISTGGSTGVARYTVITYDEWDRFNEVQGAALALLGVGPSDRVANLFIAGSLWPSFIGVHETIRRVGAVHLPISGNIPVESILRFCQEFDPTVILSLPTAFVFLADHAMKDGLKFPSLRLVGYGGEQMSAEAEAHVRRGLGPRDVAALGYSSGDAGLMGYQCPHCPPGVYHLPTGFQYLEIIDPLTGEACPPGQSGEIVVTNLARLSMPILRYRLGDVGAFLDGACVCGDANPRFRLDGRAGEDFKIGGALISMKAVDACVARFAGRISLNAMVELEDIGGQMAFRLHVEAADLDEAAACAPALREALCEAIPELAAGQKLGFITAVDIVPVRLGSLPRNPITGKAKRLNDLRIRKEDPA
jgi:phenylacetate-CoA ligase